MIHDDTLERTTNGRGEVMATSYDALRQLDAGNGERIPTLEEVLELVAGKVTVNVELKGKGTAAPVARHASLRIRRSTLLVSSFDHANSRDFTPRRRSARVAPLFHKASTRMFEIAESLQAWSINLSVKLATRRSAADDCGQRLSIARVHRQRS